MIADAHARTSHVRPPVSEWALRLALCVTDDRTQSGEVERLLQRCDSVLTATQRKAAVDAAQIIVRTLTEANETVAAIDAAAACPLAKPASGPAAPVTEPGPRPSQVRS